MSENDFTEAEWRAIFEACSQVRVHCTPGYFRAFLAQRLGARSPDLAEKVWRLDAAGLERVCLAVMEHQRAEDGGAEKDRP